MSAQPDLRPPAAVASPRSCRRAPAWWAVLDRKPLFLDDDNQEILGGGVIKYTSNNLAAPPGISTLVINRNMLPAAADIGLVECADGKGNLLLSLAAAVESATASGKSGGRLLLCLPGNGSGEALLLPEVPPDLGVHLDFGPDASCFGMVATASHRPGGCDLFVAQLQHAAAPASASSAPSSSTSSATGNRAISFYTSSSSTWATIEVARQFEARPSEEEEYMAVEEEMQDEAARMMMLEFQPHTAVAHDAKSEVLFVDLKARAILFFNPGKATARFVSFPSLDAADDVFNFEYQEAAAEEEDLRAAASRRAVGCSAGRVMLAEFSRDGGWVTMSRLEDDDRWTHIFKVTAGVPFDSTVDFLARLDRQPEPGSSQAQFPAAPPGLGPVDPANCNEMTYYAPRAGIGFTVLVDPGKDSFARVKFVEAADATTRGSSLDIVVWKLDPAASQSSDLIREVVGKTKRAGATAYKLMRNNADNVMHIAEGASSVLTFIGAGPLGAGVVATAATLVKANKFLGAGEDVARKVGDWWTSGKLDVRAVKDERDAVRVIEEWRDSGEPKNMRAQFMPGLNQQQVRGLRECFRLGRAEELLRDDDM